jgi:DNA invertase Pin-like site-specific DNA recombinase
LPQTLAHLREGDVLMIWKLDRLGRSLRHLIEVVTDLAQRGIGFQSLQEQLNTTTSTGKLVSHMFGALAEFERDLIREQTQGGLVAARAGPPRRAPPGLSKQAEATALAAETLYQEGKLSVVQIAEKLSIAKSTLYVYLRHRGVVIGSAPQALLPPPGPRLRRVPRKMIDATARSRQRTDTKESRCARRPYPN